jgi:hypothetical protein
MGCVLLHGVDLFVRLLKRAVKFASASPFINPSRASPLLTSLHTGRYVIAERRTQNAVFLTTGLITECSLVNAVGTWASSGAASGPPVKRIRLRPFSVEFERAAAYFGCFLGLGDSEEYGGPVYNEGLSFGTRKEGATKRVLISLLRESAS